MKRTLVAAAGLALLAATGAAHAVSWSVVVAPGIYGRVAVGGYAQPPQVYSDDPVVAATLAAGGGQPGYPAPTYDDQPPVYLWVPQAHRQHWSWYCTAYGACNVPVYFVQDRWYDDYVMNRRWSQEQRAWNQQQWLEQDRIARERWAHARWDREQARREREERQWAEQRAWDRERRDPPRFDREQAERERQDRVRWEPSRGRDTQPAPAWQPGPHPQPGFAPWQASRPVLVEDRQARGHDGDHERGRGKDHADDHRNDRGDDAGRGDRPQRNDRVDPRHRDDADAH